MRAAGVREGATARAAELREGTVRAIERGGMPTLDTLEQLAFVNARQPRPIVLFTGESVPWHADVGAVQVENRIQVCIGSAPLRNVSLSLWPRI